jgi:hypothetical protein
MLTRFVAISPVRTEPQRALPHRATTGSGPGTRRQAEVREHLIALEQATIAAFEGYLSRPLYHRAAHAAQRLLALAETLDWREGRRVARAMVSLFQTDTAFGLVHALHLSELLAALYRAMTQAAAGQPPYGSSTAAVGGLPLSVPGHCLSAVLP